ncbi:MAG: response regulator transcription factor [Thermodesulfobacteriota bacterium]
MIKPVRILIAEDHALVRAGFCALLKTLSGIQSIYEAGHGREALEMIRTHKPDIVLMDIAMPGLNGLEAARRILEEFSQIRILILSMHSNEEYILQALRIGVSGYLLKDAGLAELELAIQAVLRGETFLSPSISKHLINQYLKRTDLSEGPFKDLTPRQREILQLIAEGNTTKEIAVKLDLSIKTVETHRTQIMDRLDIHDVAGLVRYSIRRGLISSEK